jgi:hypothetical protein
LNGVESYLREQVVSLILYLPPENLGQSHAVPDLVICSAMSTLSRKHCATMRSPAGRSGPAVADGAFTHLQAMNRLALDRARQHAGGLSVTSLPAFGCVDSADPHTYLGAIGFHGEGVSVGHG